MSASRNAAIAKPSRIVIPDEYVRTGRSIAFSSSANATISSNRCLMSARRSPWIAPFRKTFSRPVKSRWNPAPELEQRADAALRSELRPAVGLMIPAISRSSVVLPGAVPADEPDRLAARDLRGDVAKRPDVGRLRLPALDEEILQRARLARVDAKAPRDAVDADLANVHAT